MLKTLKTTMYNIGDGTGHLAKRVGGGTADLAKRVGSGTADLAQRIGPRRAIIGVAVIGVVVVGSIMLVRYMRSRKEDLPFEEGDEQMRGRSGRRRARRDAEAQFQH